MGNSFRCCLAIFLTGVLAGESARCQSLNERLLADAADRRLDDFDFVSAYLIAGGVTDARELAELHSQFEELRQRIDPAAIRALPVGVRAQELRARLHSQILVGSYRQEASDLRLAIRCGDYNCLSAAAIYWALAEEAKIELEIWSRPGHVYLARPGSRERIEPGSAAWNVSALENLPDSPAPPARRITPLQLVGKYYYNRGLVWLQEGRHAEGVELIRTSLRLDPQDREARGNLLAGLNNWAVALCCDERFAEAGRLIAQGLAIDDGYAPLVANDKYVRSQASR
jgi:tetratricopeptide (TPR) repeat protein